MNDKQALIDIMKEASDIIESFSLCTCEEHHPSNFRQPIIDELYGFALMLEDEQNKQN